ncbi:hypothetical protein FKM82_013717 [Ascaphus truei]
MYPYTMCFFGAERVRFEDLAKSELGLIRCVIVYFCCTASVLHWAARLCGTSTPTYSFFLLIRITHYKAKPLGKISTTPFQ